MNLKSFCKYINNMGTLSDKTSGESLSHGI